MSATFALYPSALFECGTAAMLIYDQSVYIMLPLAVCYDCSSILLCIPLKLRKTWMPIAFLPLDHIKDCLSVWLSSKILMIKKLCIMEDFWQLLIWLGAVISMIALKEFYYPRHPQYTHLDFWMYWFVEKIKINMSRFRG